MASVCVCVCHLCREEKQTTAKMEEELNRLRAEREEENGRVSAEQQRIAELQRQLEEIKAQKKKKDCVIL